MLFSNKITSQLRPFHFSCPKIEHPLPAPEA